MIEIKKHNSLKTEEEQDSKFYSDMQFRSKVAENEHICFVESYQKF